MNIPAPFSQNQMRFFWNCFDHWFNVAEGGKRGGKNVLITMAYCTILEKHPSRIHLIAGVSTATARLNILDCDGFGLKNYFEGRCREGTYQNRDCLYIQTATGEKVVLVSGGGKAGDEKLIKGNTYGTAYITEANECSETFIKEVFDRTLSSPDRKVFHDLNPKAEGHWYYENILNLHEKKQNENPEYGFNYGHFTIADNMSISDDQLRAVLATYDRSTVWYARDILGKRKAAEGLVYPFFSAGQDTYLFHGDASHIDGQFYVSIDYGTHNPCSMGLWVIHDGKALRIKESYFDSRAERVQRTDEEHYAELERLTKGYYIQAVVVDPSAASFIETIRRHGKYLVIPADNDVLNGIRCVAKYAHDKGLTDRARFSIISGGKVKYMDLTVENGVTKAIRVDMGEPILTAAEVPVVSKNRQSVDEEITVENQTYRMTCVSMGNPHAVVFVDSTADLPLEQIGPHFEHHERFPRRTNTEFVEIVSPEYVKMRVWERGTGETLACGTGCCATAVACVLNGKTGRKVTVEVLGGALTIQWDEKTNHIFMTGPAEFVFDGELEYEV